MSGPGHMAVAGENIPSGEPVGLSMDESKVFVYGRNGGGPFIGTAVESIREGFRISNVDEKIREDDA